MQLLGSERAAAAPTGNNWREVEQLAGIRGARILLVEDNALNQEVASELLTQAGMAVDIAENGAVALAKVQSADYDLVLMDMQMPVMDGLTATAEIRKLPGMRDLPIVAMTANAMQQDYERCVAAGINDHVAKPIEPERLWTALLRWITPRTAAPSAAPAAAGGGLSPALAAIAGLDTAAGLRFVNGKVALYTRMLGKFADSGEIAALRTAFTCADAATTRRVAHTLKGVAGTLGATVLQQNAAALETAISETAPEAVSLAAFEAELQATETEFARLRDAIRAANAAAD